MWATFPTRHFVKKLPLMKKLNYYARYILIVSIPFSHESCVVFSLKRLKSKLFVVLVQGICASLNPFNNRKSNHVLKTAINWNFRAVFYFRSICYYCVFQSSFLSLFHLHTIAHHIPVLIAPHSLVMLLLSLTSFLPLLLHNVEHISSPCFIKASVKHVLKLAGF